MDFIKLLLLKPLGVLLAISIIGCSQPSKLPLVAIANFGPHPSLQANIDGMLVELSNQGFQKDRDYTLASNHVSFEPSMIRPMLSQLIAQKPTVLVTLTTPVAQAAKSLQTAVPQIFASITDPVEAKLLKTPGQAEKNITGATDRQNLYSVLALAKQLLPNSKRMGMMYATSEANDAALKKMLEKEVKAFGLELLAVGIDQARDIPLRMKLFDKKVDFIYVGVGGTIQPALPAIVSAADKIKIPVFNADESGVLDNMALASCGVSYKKVGINTGKLVADILRGKKVESLSPIEPDLQDHVGYISAKKAAYFGLTAHKYIPNLRVVE